MIKYLFFPFIAMLISANAQTRNADFFRNNGIAEVKIYWSDIYNDRVLSGQLFIDSSGCIYKELIFGRMNDSVNSSPSMTSTIISSCNSLGRKVKSTVYLKDEVMSIHENYYIDGRRVKNVSNNKGKISVITTEMDKKTDYELYKEMDEKGVVKKSEYIKKNNVWAASQYKRIKGRLQLASKGTEYRTDSNEVIKADISFYPKDRPSYVMSYESDFSSGAQTKRCYSYSDKKMRDYCEYYEYIKK